MSLRKEQILAILAVLAAVWMIDGLVEPEAARMPRSRPLAYEPTGVPRSPLVAPAAEVTPWSQGLFAEPSETRPLPPRDLDLPPARAFGVVAMPLQPGPGPAWLHQLELAPRPAEAGDIELTDPTSGVAGGDAGDNVNQGGGDSADPGWGTTGRPSKEELARTYDQVDNGPRGVTWGFIEAYNGLDKYDLALLGAAELPEIKKIKIREYRLSTGRLANKAREEDVQPVSITLADTLRNQVELAKRRVKKQYDAGGLFELYDLGEQLLVFALRESWVYDEALVLADRLIEITNGGLQAYRFKQRVLRLRGDLAGELALYEGIPEGTELDTFRLLGRGQLKARLGLWEDAELDLRAALATRPQDAEALAALATLLLDRGRVLEGSRFAARGWAFHAGQPMDVQMMSASVHLRALLGQGKVEDAREVVRNLPDGDPAEVAHLTGCVAYASGNLTQADDEFANAAASPDVAISSMGTLGLAAVAARDGQWQQALDAFAAVVDADPLLRHRAHTGIALVYARVGQHGRALEALDSAARAAPDDAYMLYLRGRVLRERGDYTAAVDALEACLEQNDDMLHALLEMVLCREALADAAPAQEADHLFRALRYADRLVELAAARGADFRFFEVQGRVHYRAKQLRTADQAFSSAIDGAQDGGDQLYSEAGRGLVLYAQGRVEDARDRFLAMQDGLRRGDSYWIYADGIVDAINDHSKKVQLVDRFERESIGSIWDDRGARGALRIVDGEAVFDRRLEGPPIAVPRKDAVGEARRFLGAEVSLRMLETSDGALAGLNLLVSPRNTGRKSFEVWYGIRGSDPYLMVEESNPSEPVEPVEGLKDAVGVFDPREPQRLGLYVQAQGDGPTLELVATWNDLPIHRQPLRGSLTANTRGELLVQLGGKGRGKVKGVFDDLRILRKEVE